MGPKPGFKREISEKAIRFEWKTLPADRETILVIRSADRAGAPLLRKVVKPQAGAASASWIPVTAGSFKWELLDKAGVSAQGSDAQGQFVIEPKLEAPVSVLPENNATFTLESLKRNGSAILLTWKKVRGAATYRIEIGRAENTTAPIVKSETSDNFFVFKSPEAGRYWWRTRSYREDGSPGLPGSTLTLEVTP